MDKIQVKFVLAISFQKTTFRLATRVSDYRLSRAYIFFYMIWACNIFVKYPMKKDCLMLWSNDCVTYIFCMFILL